MPTTVSKLLPAVETVRRALLGGFAWYQTVAPIGAQGGEGSPASVVAVVVTAVIVLGTAVSEVAEAKASLLSAAATAKRSDRVPLLPAKPPTCTRYVVPAVAVNVTLAWSEPRTSSSQATGARALTALPVYTPTTVSKPLPLVSTVTRVVAEGV